MGEWPPPDVVVGLFALLVLEVVGAAVLIWYIWDKGD